MARWFVLAAAQAALFAGLAVAGVLDFADEFDTFDAGRWSKGDHRLGRSYLDPNNASVAEGNLRVKLPARTLNGGEIRSKSLYGYGSHSVRMKLPHAPSSITGFFLYYPPDYASEIDIEVYNDSSRRLVIHGTYANGGQTNTETVELPFDPTNGFHEYSFYYAPGSVTFYADDTLMRTWTEGVPTASMNLYLNSWYPAWLEGRKPNKDRYVLVDRIEHTRW